MFVTLLLLGGGLVAFSLSPWLALALPFLFVAGFGYLASNTHATSRLQLGVEPWERGRIMALWSVAFLGLRPFASILDGAIAAAFGVSVAGVVLALPALGCAVLDGGAGAVARLGPGARRAPAGLGNRERAREDRLLQAVALRLLREHENGHRAAAGERRRDVVADHRAERRAPRSRQIGTRLELSSLRPRPARAGVRRRDEADVEGRAAPHVVGEREPAGRDGSASSPGSSASPRRSGSASTGVQAMPSVVEV